jgi:molybdate transport system substrate-binding protein
MGSAGTLGVVAALVLLWGCGGRAEKPPRRLLFYAANGLRPPLSEAAEVFGRENGCAVDCDFAGSNTLLGKLRVSQRGDLYMPGDEWYVEEAAKAGFQLSRHTVCYWAPVLLVKKGNPKEVRTLQDLLKPGVQVGLGDARACAIGRTSVALLEKNGLRDADLAKNVVYRSTTVNELANHVKAGQVDAAIVWDATAAQYPDVAEAVPIPAERNLLVKVEVCVLKFTEAREQAERFCEFLKSAKGQAIFRRHHYRVDAPR